MMYSILFNIELNGGAAMCSHIKIRISRLLLSLKFVSHYTFSVSSHDDEAKQNEETDREIPRWRLLLILVLVAYKM